MNFTDEQFEALKTRYIQRLRFYKKTFINKSRNQDTGQLCFGATFELISEMELDEFSQIVSDGFILPYELGWSIDQILDHLINDVRVKFLDNYSKRIHYKTVVVPKRLFGIKTPFVKYHEVYDYKGELKERYKLKTNLSREKLKQLREMKFESKDQFWPMAYFLLTKKEFLYQKVHPMTSHIIDPYVSDPKKWFKALVKYRAKREFMPELYALQLEPEQQVAVTQIREKRKTDTFKAVKWTDGRIKNNFPKLIYALHRAGYLENGQGEITKIVEQLAPAFGLELGDWESNLSKHINKTKNGHDYEAFFEELKKSFREIVDQRRDDDDSKSKAKPLN